MRLPGNMPSRPKRGDQPIYVAVAGQAGLSLQADWAQCAACCAGKAGFLACVARCTATGQACDGGLNNCTPC
jgi:hypothetical protein